MGLSSAPRHFIWHSTCAVSYKIGVHDSLVLLAGLHWQVSASATAGNTSSLLLLCQLCHAEFQNGQGLKTRMGKVQKCLLCNARVWVPEEKLICMQERWGQGRQPSGEQSNRCAPTLCCSEHFFVLSKPCLKHTKIPSSLYNFCMHRATNIWYRE